MDNTKKVLKNSGSTILVLAICDAINFISALIFDWETFKIISQEPDKLVAKVATIIMICAIAISAATIALQIFAGAKSMKLVEKPSDAVSHIRIAKTLAIFLLVINVISVLGTIGEKASVTYWLNTVVDILNVIALFIFVKAAKAFRKSYLNSKN